MRVYGTTSNGHLSFVVFAIFVTVVVRRRAAGKTKCMPRHFCDGTEPTTFCGTSNAQHSLAMVGLRMNEIADAGWGWLSRYRCVVLQQLN